MLPVQREVIDDFARKRYRELTEKVRKEAPPSIGLMEAARILDRRELAFRGRPYHVPPVPWPLGAEILEVLERVTKSRPAIEDLKRAAVLTKQACRPVTRLDRLFWRFEFYNPFAASSRPEVGRNLGFCWLFHVLDSVAFAMAEAPALGTSSPTSPDSRSGSPRGPARTASRSPGPIS